MLGLPTLIEQAWQRYGRTIAITECHNGASREEQVRWFVEVWEGVEELGRRGVDLCAVTAWSLLGSHDWNRMVTRFIGHYETGVYDVRTGTPRPTLHASVLKDLAAGRKPRLHAIAGPGSWRRESRLIHSKPKSEPKYELSSPGDCPWTDRLFMPWDRSARAVAMLDAFDAGQPVTIHASGRWTGVYGPDVMDVLLDLLLGGVIGVVSARPNERVSELEFARGLNGVATGDPDLVVATGSPAPAPLFTWSAPAAYLPPIETTLERLVRESRAVRPVGELAVKRRVDEPRLEAAE